MGWQVSPALQASHPRTDICHRGEVKQHPVMKIFGCAGSPGSCQVRRAPRLGKFIRWAGENRPAAPQTKPASFQNKQSLLQAPARGAVGLPATTEAQRGARGTRPSYLEIIPSFLRLLLGLQRCWRSGRQDVSSALTVTSHQHSCPLPPQKRTNEPVLGK